MKTKCLKNNWVDDLNRLKGGEVPSLQFLLYSLSSLIIGSPRRPSRRLFAASADIALRVAYDALAICGRITVEVNVKKETKREIKKIKKKQTI